MAQMPWEMDYSPDGQPVQAGLGRPIIQRNPQPSPQTAPQRRKDELTVAEGEATLPYAAPTAHANAQKAAADAAAAVEAARIKREEADKQKQGQWQGKVSSALQADHVLGQLKVAHEQIDSGHDTGNVFGTNVFQKVPFLGQNAANLGATLTGIQGSVINDTVAQLKAQSANGSSGYGALSETEATRLAAAVGALQQTQDAASLKRNLKEVEKHYRTAKALLNGDDPRVPHVAKQYGIDRGTGEFNQQVLQMIKEGADVPRIKAFYQSTGRPFPAESQKYIGDAIRKVRGAQRGQSSGWSIEEVK